MKLLRYLFLGIAALSLHSCSDITEEIHLNEDGSGSYKFSLDFSAMRKRLFEHRDQGQDALNEDMIWEDLPQGEIDSVFDYAEALDSSSHSDFFNDPEAQKLYARMTGFMEGGRKKGYLNMGVKFSFHDPEDLHSLTKRLEDDTRVDVDGYFGIPKLDELKFETTYSLTKNVFTRTTKYTGAPVLEGDDMKIYELWFSNIKLRTIVYLPEKKRVKEVKGGTVVLQEKNKVIVEYSMMDFMLGKQSNDFEIVLK